jgi:hypothetical protein
MGGQPYERWFVIVVADVRRVGPYVKNVLLTSRLDLVDEFHFGHGFLL